jgi:hypothetical protein
MTQATELTKLVSWDDHPVDSEPKLPKHAGLVALGGPDVLPD